MKKNSNEKLQWLYANAANEFTLTRDLILSNWEGVPNHNSVFSSCSNVSELFRRTSALKNSPLFVSVQYRK